MTTFSITLPDSNSSKQDEIDLIQKIAQKFAGTQSYLSDLFTEELAAWAAGQITNDFAPDVMDNLNTARKDNDVLTAENTRIRKDLEAARDNTANIVEQWKNKVERLEASLRESREEVQRIAGQRNEYYQMWLDQCAQTEQRDAELYVLQQTVRDLKAMCFDLEHPAR